MDERMYNFYLKAFGDWNKNERFGYKRSEMVIRENARVVLERIIRNAFQSAYMREAGVISFARFVASYQTVLRVSRCCNPCIGSAATMAAIIWASGRNR